MASPRLVNRQRVNLAGNPNANGILMSDFADVARRLMDERGMSVRALAKAVRAEQGYVSRVLRGLRPAGPDIARRIDDALRADGEIIRAAAQVPKPARVPKLGGTKRKSAAVEALQVAMTGDPDAGAAAAGLSELVAHYALEASLAPSRAVHDDLISARAFAGTLLGRVPGRDRGDLTVTAGWLSALLAVTALDLGDHAAAIVWCADAARRGRDAGFGELAGWSAFTRSLIAWYQDRPSVSAEHARRGQSATGPGSAAYVRLAAQEMRSLAALGDAEGMTAARRRAADAMAALPAAPPMPGVFTVPRAADPPYTATSLLATGRYAETAAMTRDLIGTIYRPQDRPPAQQPTNYARTLLILALAAAGIGDADEASAIGQAALECGQVVWPTMVLASRLDRALNRQAAGSAHAEDFRVRYMEADRILALPAAGAGQR